MNEFFQRLYLSLRSCFTLGAVRRALIDQGAGIALLTLLPFIASGIVFAPFSASRMDGILSMDPAIFTPVVAAFVFVLSVLSALAQRAPRFFMPVCSALILLLLAIDFHLPDPPIAIGTGNRTVIYAIYAFTSLLTILLLSTRRTVSTLLFRAIVIVLALDILLSLASAGQYLLGPLFISYFPSHVSVVIALLVILTLRMVVKFGTDNRDLMARIEEYDPRFVRTVFGKTLRLWWPMLALFAGLTLFYQMINESHIRQPLIRFLDGYATTGDGLAVYPDGESIPLALPNLPSQSMEGAAAALIDRISDRKEAEMQKGLATIVATKEDGKEAVLRQTEEAMPPRFPGTQTARCRFLDIGCYITNGVKSMINSGYQSAKASMIADVDRRLSRLNQDIEDYQEAASAEITKSFDVFKKQSRQRISDVATSLFYIQWAVFLYTIVILLKSFLIVFARVFYSRAKVTSVNAEGEADAQNSARGGRMKALKSQHQISSVNGTRYYFTFKTCGNNVIDRRRIPQPFSLALGRFLAGNYVMCLIDLSSHRDVQTCDIIVDPPAEITQWELKDGNEILFDLSALIGFSEGCRLGRRISLSIGSLIFGRILYYSVRGPGTIYLRTQSVPIGGTATATMNVMQASSLIAWRSDAEFNVISSLTVGDTFMSGYSIRKAGPRGHMVLYDTSQSRRVGTGRGILRLARSFLLPF